MAMQYEALVHPRASRRWEVGNRGEDDSPGEGRHDWASQTNDPVQCRVSSDFSIMIRT